MGLGSYCLFLDDPSIVADRGFEVPQRDGVRLTSLVTVSLGGVGTIARVVNDTGDQVDDANLTSYVTEYGGQGSGGESELLSLDRPAIASSVESADYTPASAAFDGDPGTRWSSEFSDDQWIQVDLGSTHDLTSAELVWEAAYASAYEIQVSDDGQNWTTVHITTDGQGGTETIALDASGRHVRMQGLERATGYGFSLWSFDVYGSAA
ncbi:hypothetical protein GCM10029992_64560 [Glycomyces albus]